MKHEDFRQVLRDAEIGEAFETIERRILPWLTQLIESAAGDAPGQAARADELRALAAQLEELRALVESGQPRALKIDAK